jgi:hypothetical protein
MQLVSSFYYYLCYTVLLRVLTLFGKKKTLHTAASSFICTLQNLSIKSCACCTVTTSVFHHDQHHRTMVAAPHSVLVENV